MSDKASRQRGEDEAHFESYKAACIEYRRNTPSTTLMWSDKECLAILEGLRIHSEDTLSKKEKQDLLDAYLEENGIDPNQMMKIESIRRKGSWQRNPKSPFKLSFKGQHYLSTEDVYHKVWEMRKAHHPPSIRNMKKELLLKYALSAVCVSIALATDPIEYVRSEVANQVGQAEPPVQAVQANPPVQVQANPPVQAVQANPPVQAVQANPLVQAVQANPLVQANPPVQVQAVQANPLVQANPRVQANPPVQADASMAGPVVRQSGPNQVAFSSQHQGFQGLDLAAFARNGGTLQFHYQPVSGNYHSGNYHNGDVNNNNNNHLNEEQAEMLQRIFSNTEHIAREAEQISSCTQHIASEAEQISSRTEHTLGRVDAIYTRTVERNAAGPPSSAQRARHEAARDGGKNLAADLDAAVDSPPSKSNDTVPTSPKDIDELVLDTGIVTHFVGLCQQINSTFGQPKKWDKLKGQLEDSLKKWVDEELKHQGTTLKAELNRDGNFIRELLFGSALEAELKRDGNFIQQTFQGIEPYVLDVSTLAEISATELLNKAEGQGGSSFGTFGFTTGSEPIGAILHLNRALTNGKPAYSDIIEGLGFDITTMVDDAENNVAVTISYRQEGRAVAARVLEWLLSRNAYKKLAWITGPQSEVADNSTVEFNLSAYECYWQKLGFEKIALSSAQQEQVLRHVQGIVLKDCVLDEEGEPLRNRITHFHSAGVLRTSRLDVQGSIQFGKSTMISLLRDIKKLQGKSTTLNVVIHAHALIDAVSKFGTPLVEFLGKAIADNQKSVENIQGQDNNSVDFLFFPVESSSIQDLRKLAYFTSRVIKEAERILEHSKKYKGRCIKSVESDRWPFSFMAPGEPLDEKAELEINLFKEFVLQYLGKNPQESAQMTEVVRKLRNFFKESDDSDFYRFPVVNLESEESIEPCSLQEYLSAEWDRQKTIYESNADSKEDIVRHLRSTQELALEQLEVEISELEVAKEKPEESEAPAKPTFAFLTDPDNKPKSAAPFGGGSDADNKPKSSAPFGDAPKTSGSAIFFKNAFDSGSNSGEFNFCGGASVSQPTNLGVGGELNVGATASSQPPTNPDFGSSGGLDFGATASSQPPTNPDFGSSGGLDFGATASFQPPTNPDFGSSGGLDFGATSQPTVSGVGRGGGWAFGAPQGIAPSTTKELRVRVEQFLAKQVSQAPLVVGNVGSTQTLGFGTQSSSSPPPTQHQVMVETVTESPDPPLNTQKIQTGAAKDHSLINEVQVGKTLDNQEPADKTRADNGAAEETTLLNIDNLIGNETKDEGGSNHHSESLVQAVEATTHSTRKPKVGDSVRICTTGQTGKLTSMNGWVKLDDEKDGKKNKQVALANLQVLPTKHK